MKKKEKETQVTEEYEKKVSAPKEGLKAANAEMETLCAELDEAKKTILTLKKANAALKGYNKKLSSNLSQLYNAEVKKVEEKEKVIKGLESQVTQLYKDKKEIEEKLDKGEQAVKAYREKYAAVADLPWYKRIFLKKE